MLGILEAVNEVFTNNVRVIQEWIIGRVDGSIGLFLGKDLLVTLSAANVLPLALADEACVCKQNE